MLAFALLDNDLEDQEADLNDRIDRLQRQAGTFLCGCISNGEADKECLSCYGTGEEYLWYQQGPFEWLIYLRLDQWHLRETVLDDNPFQVAKFEESRTEVAALATGSVCDAVISCDGSWMERGRDESSEAWGEKVQELLDANHDRQVVLCLYGEFGIDLWSASADEVRVTSTRCACPACGERRVDNLLGGQGLKAEYLVRCMSCMHLYELPTEEESSP